MSFFAFLVFLSIVQISSSVDLHTTLDFKCYRIEGKAKRQRTSYESKNHSLGLDEILAYHLLKFPNIKQLSSQGNCENPILDFLILAVHPSCVMFAEINIYDGRTYRDQHNFES